MQFLSTSAIVTHFYLHHFSRVSLSTTFYLKCISQEHLRNVLKMSTHFTPRDPLSLFPTFSLSYIIILYLLFRKMVLKYHLDFKTVFSIFISFDNNSQPHQI